MKFVRMWRLYLAGSVAAFTTGTLQLPYGVAPGEQRRSLTRAHLYRADTATACEVLIVGGGPAGAAAAWKLRRAGTDVLILDQNDSRA
jgi:NADPH-dependent 2,4-dienoyl-CoA reductase/sulfur reductase-like enzyme